jgi:hypothetical protein
MVDSVEVGNEGEVDSVEVGNEEKVDSVEMGSEMLEDSVEVGMEGLVGLVAEDGKRGNPASRKKKDGGN